MHCEPTSLEVLLTKAAFRFYGKTVYKAFADRLQVRGGESVLDFGCGMGTVAYYVAKALAHGQLFCVDISDKWISACRRNLRKFSNVRIGKYVPGTLEPETFDLVYCHFVLHDISKGELMVIVPELTRSLKTGGVLVLREPFGETEKICFIKRLFEQNSLLLKDSRITDVPMMGNALESVYIK